MSPLSKGSFVLSRSSFTTAWGCPQFVTSTGLSTSILSSHRGDGQNTEAQSMDYPNGLPLKWTTPKNNNPNECYLIFLAARIIKLNITSAYVHPVQPLATSMTNWA